MTTVLRPKPTPRTRLTATIVYIRSGASSASAGPPSSNAPKANTTRLPYRRMRAGAANSAATQASIKAAVTRPATELPAPADTAYIGVTDSSR